MQPTYTDDGRAIIDGKAYAPGDILPDGRQAGAAVADYATRSDTPDDARTAAARYLATAPEWRSFAAQITGASSGGKKQCSQAERKRRAARMAHARAARWGK